MTRTSLTEETPAAPGWVDRRVRDIFGPLGPDGAAIGNAYADCLAGVRGSVDVGAGHDRCRKQALASLAAAAGDVGELERTLQALEAELSEAT